MSGKTVNKKFYDIDSFYIGYKEVSKVIPKQPELHIEFGRDMKWHDFEVWFARTRNRNNGLPIVCFGTVFHNKTKFQDINWVLTNYTIKW